MDNEAFSVSDDHPALSMEGAGRKVITFSRFLSRVEEDEDDKFKIKKKVHIILDNEYLYRTCFNFISLLEAATDQRNPRIPDCRQSEQQDSGREPDLPGLQERDISHKLL